MTASTKFILIKSHAKEVLINAARIESVRATGDPNVCAVHMIGDDEDQWFHAQHTMQDLIFILDEAADVFITGLRVTHQGVVERETEFMAHNDNS